MDQWFPENGWLSFLGCLPLRVVIEGNKETWQDDEYVHYINCSDGSQM